MKICFFGSDYPPTGGGIATYVVETIRTISKSSEISEMPVYIFGNKNPRQEKLAEKITVTTYVTKNFFAIGVLVLKKMWINRDATIFHALYVFPVGLWVVVWAKLLCRKSIVTIYGTDVCSKEGSFVTRRLKRWTLILADKVIAISQFTKQMSVRTLSLSVQQASSIFVLYPTVPTVSTKKTKAEVAAAVLTFQQKLGLPPDAFPVLSVCRLVSRKGLEYLIEAIKQIADPRVVLLVAGGGPEKERFEDLVVRYGLERRVFLLGKVPDLVPLYRLAKAGVLASFSRVTEGDFEGLGLVLLEAQSFGLPVIGTNSGGIPEAFDQGKTGMLVPEQNVGALAKAIETLHIDTALYANMSATTKVFLEGRFGQERMTREYLSLAESLS